MRRNKLGLGAMLGILGVGTEETVNSIRGSVGKKIKNAGISDDQLQLTFTDGTGLRFWDNGQSCCESRYMSTDDDLSSFAGAEFRDVELADAPDMVDEYETHEVQFLWITTSKGKFSIANHNEHSGYYGGFDLRASTLEVRKQRSSSAL